MAPAPAKKARTAATPASTTSKKPSQATKAGKVNVKASVKANGKGAVPVASKRKRAASVSSIDSSESSGDEDDDEDAEGGVDGQAAMLAALEAHGRAMFGGLLGTQPESSKQAAARAERGEDESDDDDADDDSEDSDDEGFHTDDGWGADGAFVTDSEDEFASSSKPKATKATTAAKAKPAAPSVPEVVFAETPKPSTSFVSKADKRAFLQGNSAKMMGIKKEVVAVTRREMRALGGSSAKEDEAEDESNLRLDKTLHDMLLTTLLPGAAADAAARPVEKRNALSGRLLELASYSLPGEGTNIVKGNSLSSHPAAVRTGLIHAQQRRAEKARAEAEAAGSWVKGVGGLGDLGKRGAGVRPSGQKKEERAFGVETGRKKGMSGKKSERAKGLGMGVGKFSNGTLTISENQIARVNNIGKGGGGKKKKGKGGSKW